MKKTKKSGKAYRMGFDSAVDNEDLMSMNREELAEVAREFKGEADQSQAETLAKNMMKLDPAAQALALKNLRRDDVFLFETIEYLMQRIKRK